MSPSPPRPVLAALLLAAALGAHPGAAAAASPADRAAVARLANGCFRLGGSGPISFKPTGLGTTMLVLGDGQLLGIRADASAGPLGGPEAAGPRAEWAPARVAPGTFTFVSTRTRRGLAVSPGGAVSAADAPARLRLTRANGCTRFPEAGLGARGTPRRALRADGTVDGFADTHLHITADMRAGGRVIGGEPFDRFGITRALGRDAEDHGPDGALDYTGNLLRDGIPFGTHDTGGWPAFKGWPTHDTNSHEQVYFRWLQRAWLSGLRLVVAQTVEDTELCKAEPKRRYSCDETTAIRGQIRRLRALQDYVDAQSGGRGRGFFRLVTSPAQARRVAGTGRLAVVIGVESSFPLDCRDQPGRAPCTPAQVDRRLDALHALGVRSLFIAHWADNGFAGAAIEGGTKGKFINALARSETGHYFTGGACPQPGQGEVLEALGPLELTVLGQFFPATQALAKAPQPTYPTARVCNVRGLTPLGAHLVRRMMAKGMLIEADHLSERAREDVLDLAERARYPLVSSHSDTGGTWSTAELRRLTALGGIASQRLGAAPELARAIVRRTRYAARGRLFGVGLGTDTGGFASLPGAAPDAASKPLRYPFRVHGGGVSFTRQRTGERTFDVNTDGVAHYGLLPELLADVERRPQGERALGLLFRSAEAYLRTWELAERRR